ncbi:hypothetical protein OUZ56_012404 [Daphnia magna]|uniref:Uncharacterized protein n=1 Tax=Daphnia magna TaxID=35525 RepID=A0ABQ9Z2X6_9CRUS|nr:hypothetical protein OUZ56_012404 [Daphnia magna]
MKLVSRQSGMMLLTCRYVAHAANQKAFVTSLPAVRDYLWKLDERVCGRWSVNEPLLLDSCKIS